MEFTALKLFCGLYPAVITPVNILSLLIRNYLSVADLSLCGAPSGGHREQGCRPVKRHGSENKVSFQRNPQHTKWWPRFVSFHYCCQAGALIKILPQCVFGILRYVISGKTDRSKLLSQAFHSTLSSCCSLILGPKKMPKVHSFGPKCCWRNLT